jgi:hypothetical protein
MKCECCASLKAKHAEIETVSLAAYYALKTPLSDLVADNAAASAAPYVVLSEDESVGIVIDTSAFSGPEDLSLSCFAIQRIAQYRYTERAYSMHSLMQGSHATSYATCAVAQMDRSETAPFGVAVLGTWVTCLLPSV